VIDRVLGQNAAEREPGMARTDDDRGEALDGGLP
jgi:hypothetical protein